MARHSTLTNPNDLHYAKVRSFTGDPANLTPDFADELIIATDTNKIYRATDTAQGAIVELVAGNGNGNNANQITIGYEYPSARPQSQGELFYNALAKRLYISVQNYFGAYWWRPIDPLENIFNCSIAIHRDAPLTPADFNPVIRLLYAEATAAEIESGDFNFTRVLREDLVETENVDLSYYLNEFGRGAYAIAHEVNPLITSVVPELNLVGAIPSGFEIRTTNFNFAFNGEGLKEKKYIYFSGDKPEGSLTISVDIYALVIGPG